MTIALTAHDAKKELMVQFCIAYCGILSHHSLCGTGTTCKMVAEATGLEIVRFLSGEQGGDQQIAARIACNEIDLLLFFRDPLTQKEAESDRAQLLRLYPGGNQYRYGGGIDPRIGTRRPGLAKYCPCRIIMGKKRNFLIFPCKKGKIVL